jgi:uncharacterized DUF497 family protein
MEFEFDAQKSATNKAKHGIDFTEAQRLWHDPERVEVPARTEDEPRWLLIAKLEGKVWSAVFARRGTNTRIISVRRSREGEVVLYEG